MSAHKESHNHQKEEKDQTSGLRSRHASGIESYKRAKLVAIHEALQADPVNVAALRKYAISNGGLLTEEVRRKAWPKLLNVNPFESIAQDAIIKEHRDYDQVVLDVNRSLKRFPPGMKDEDREVLQDQLVEVIVRVLCENHQLHYYQGYHDICVTFLLMVGKEAAVNLVNRLSTHHLRDFMDSTMDRTKHMLNYLLPIINKSKPALYDFLQRSEVGTVFALAWLITWYSHVLNSFRSIVRLYDFFLACHPLMPVYLAAAIVLYREEDIMQCECDMPFVHSLLSKIPQNLPLEKLIVDAGDLFVQYQPSQLAKEARLYYKESTSVTAYQNLQESSRSQRPDSVLRRLTRRGRTTPASRHPQESNRVVKIAVWAISMGIGVAALTVLNTALEFWS